MPLIGPKKKPDMKPGDFHLIVNDEAETLKIYDHTGKLLKTLPALAKGWNGPSTRRVGGDTPPGLYLQGQFYPWDKSQGAEVLDTYGHICFDMVEQEGQENERGRSGISHHGGRPGAAKRQDKLRVTSGCIRQYNDDLENYILPLGYRWSESHRCWVKKPNKVWYSVYQDID